MATSKRKAEQHTQVQLKPKEQALYEHSISLLKTEHTLRAYGSGHSTLYHNALLDDAHTVDVSRFIEEPKIQHGTSTQAYSILTVSAGMALGAIRDFLKPYKLKLYGTPESKTISIGGAIVCGAHNGSGLWDSMADYVIDMLLVDGTGTLQVITDPQLFVHYGLLGIVMRIRIKVFPATNVEWRHKVVSALEDVKVKDSTHSLLFGPYSGKIIQTDIYLTHKEAYRSWKRFLWDMALLPATTKLAARLISTLAYLVPSIGLLASELYTQEPDVIRDKFNYFESVPRSTAFTVEYAIPRSQLITVYKLLMQLIADYRAQGTYILRFWCRFQQASTRIYDLAYGAETAIVEITLYDKQKHAGAMAQNISAILVQHGGRVHMGKTIAEPESLRNYDFTLLKQASAQYDPERKFQNSFMRSALDTL